mgnify:CR=1 FL=1
MYSACSLFEEENEQVVEAVLEEMGDEWELHHVQPRWKHRGLKSYAVGEFCIRASPAEDQTNGFFVARFHRKRQGTAEATSEELEDGTEEAIPFYLAAKRPLSDSEEEIAPAQKKQRK